MTQEETLLHFAAPAPGDVFTEMYAYWLVVVRVGPRSLTAFTFAGTPDNPQLSEWREYADIAAFQAAFRYRAGGAYWMRYADNWDAARIDRLAAFAAAWPKTKGDWYAGPTSINRTAITARTAARKGGGRAEGANHPGRAQGGAQAP